VLLAYLFIFPLVYSSAIVTRYAFNDDYPILDNTIRRINGSVLNQALEWGRPTLALLIGSRRVSKETTRLFRGSLLEAAHLNLQS